MFAHACIVCESMRVWMHVYVGMHRVHVSLSEHTVDTGNTVVSLYTRSPVGVVYIRVSV